MIITKVACGVIVGVQQGAMVEPGSATSIGLNSGMVAVKLAYCLYLIAVRPQISLTAFVVEVAGALLETATCVCILALQFFVDRKGIQEAMLWLEMSLMALQIITIWVAITSVAVKAVKALVVKARTLVYL